FDGQGRGPARGGGHRAHRGRAPPLAVPARPAHRRLRGHRAALPGRRRVGAREMSAERVVAPAAPGRWAAEWQPHEATWIAWPHHTADWPGKFAPSAWVYGEVVRSLARGEKVRVLVASASEEARARRLLARVGAELPRVEFFRVPTDRSWTRDFGACFVRQPG